MMSHPIGQPRRKTNGWMSWAYVVEELAVLGGPADLHHPGGDDRHLVVPHARVHAERTAHALKGRRVAPRLHGGGGEEEGGGDRRRIKREQNPFRRILETGKSRENKSNYDPIIGTLNRIRLFSF